ncbi:hypothetical protein BUALT_Bualt13G0005600 [Buddleja alternifolia]|uniref:Uncharacterized protein n=1 Tax=Buddleja alternifolia TaxID=168488 RepID=A0AAV6WKG8_9LAMI|nr:hypothetical protein BUALT_Bualt13G0005600 [Buddleja alternifolia]
MLLLVLLPRISTSLSEGSEATAEEGWVSLVFDGGEEFDVAEVSIVDGAVANGEHELVAAKGANVGKRVLIDYAYNFLKKNLRQSTKV